METKMTIEQSGRRFGILSVGKGFVTIDQVIEAMTIQITEEVEKSKHRHIGAILIEMGLLTESQVIEVLKAMERDPTITEEIKVRE